MTALSLFSSVYHYLLLRYFCTVIALNQLLTPFSCKSNLITIIIIIIILLLICIFISFFQPTKDRGAAEGKGGQPRGLNRLAEQPARGRGLSGENLEADSELQGQRQIGV